MPHQQPILKRAWRAWALALGPKDPHQPNLVALFRTLIVLAYIITNIVIVAGVIHHW